jgi:hypothetical protein
VRTWTHITLDPPVAHPFNKSIILDLDHPNYSAIFSLLMASGVNKLKIEVSLSEDAKGVSGASLPPDCRVDWVNVVLK